MIMMMMMINDDDGSFCFFSAYMIQWATSKVGLHSCDTQNISLNVANEQATDLIKEHRHSLSYR